MSKEDMRLYKAFCEYNSAMWMEKPIQFARLDAALAINGS